MQQMTLSMINFEHEVQRFKVRGGKRGRLHCTFCNPKMISDEYK